MPLSVPAMGRQRVTRRGWHVAPLAAGCGEVGFLWLSGASVPAAWPCHRAGTWHVTGLVSEERGESCRQAEGPACASVLAEHLL